MTACPADQLDLSNHSGLSPNEVEARVLDAKQPYYSQSAKRRDRCYRRPTVWVLAQKIAPHLQAAVLPSPTTASIRLRSTTT